VCTAANGLHEAYSWYQAGHIEGLSELQNQLKELQKKQKECPADDTEQLEQIAEQQNAIANQLVSMARTQSAFISLSNAAQTLAWEGLCGGLGLIEAIP